MLSGNKDGIIGKEGKIMWNKVKNIISQYLSIEESRKSIVILALISITTMGLYKAYLGNDIPPNTTSAIINICGMIFGINIGNTISNMYSSYTSNKVSIPVDKDNNQINGGV